MITLKEFYTQLSELKASTLKSYIEKAKRDVIDNAEIAGTASEIKKAKQAFEKAKKRQGGISTAYGKMKEEVQQVDEGNKLNKMLKNLHARKVGSKKARIYGSQELNQIAALKKGREMLKNEETDLGEGLQKLERREKAYKKQFKNSVEKQETIEDKDEKHDEENKMYKIADKVSNVLHKIKHRRDRTKGQD